MKKPSPEQSGNHTASATMGKQLPLDGDSPEVAAVIKKYQARLRQLKQEIIARQEENHRIVEENYRQNTELRQLNQVLDEKVKERTRELEASQEQLVAQNKELKELDESKEAMMHMIVHDMKNPLTSVMGALSLSQRDSFHVDAQLRELLQDANIQSIKLRTMMDDILTMSKLRSKEFEIQIQEVDMVSLMQQSVMLMNTTMSDHKVVINYQPPERTIICNIDFQIIERVMNNLINNAIKYAPRHSEVTVETQVENGMAVVRISNWGESIQQDCHKKIFEMFGRAKPQDTEIRGTGLGLAFCKLAIEAHQGEVGVVSPLPPKDHGAQFYFTIPFCSECKPED